MFSVQSFTADSKVLREEQFKLEEALFKVTDPQEGQSSPRQDECIASTKGRKRTKPRKLLEATDVEEEETADKALLPPPTKKAKETKAKMSKLSAKVDAQRAVFEQYLKESPTYTSTSTGEPEPAIDIPIPEPIISNTDNAMSAQFTSFTALLNDSGDEGNCLEGVSRAVEVLHDDSNLFNDSTNLDEIHFLRQEVDRLLWVIETNDQEIQDLRQRLSEGCDCYNSPAPEKTVMNEISKFILAVFGPEYYFFLAIFLHHIIISRTRTTKTQTFAGFPLFLIVRKPCLIYWTSPRKM